MIIDNGTQVRLTITDLFDGLCGVQNGVLAFRPRRISRALPATMGGLIDGAPARLKVRKSPDSDGFLLATFERL